MSLYRLIYISSGKKKFGAAELQEILEVSIRNNADVGVTGMLLYLDGNFLQLLEGEKADVEAIYDRIYRDTRHHGAIVLTRGDADRRLFPDWGMGLKMLDPERDGEIAGAFRLSEEALADRLPEDVDSLGRKMIETFMQVNA